MRSSISVLTGSCLKKSDDVQTIIKDPEPVHADIEEEIKETDQLRNRKACLKAYYKPNKTHIIDSIKANDKAKYHLRYIRELNEGVILWKNVRASTREKYKLEFDNKTNKYISKL